MLWLKVFSSLMIVFFCETYLAKQFYYYHNLGLSKKALWIVTLSVDILVLISMLKISDAC